MLNVAALCCTIVLGVAPGDQYKTVAETSRWHATATYAQVVELMERLDRRSRILHLASMGRTSEGKRIPLAIIANPPVASAAQARQTGKVIVFAFGNIHAGEVCGKEALLIPARQLALDPDNPLLAEADRIPPGTSVPGASAAPTTVESFSSAFMPTA